MNTPRKDVPLMFDMTLRDWFAGQALAGLIAKSDRNISDFMNYAWTRDNLIDLAYKLADDMMQRAAQ